MISHLFTLLVASASAFSLHKVNNDQLPWSPSIPVEQLPSSYAGLIPVREGVGQLFYWYFPHPDHTKPLMIWLQGGPGGSSMLGLMLLMGPLRISSTKETNDGEAIDKKYTLTLNPNTYASDFSMLFIDQPVGTGFSFVNQSLVKPSERFEEHVLDDASKIFWDEGLGVKYTPTVSKKEEWYKFFNTLSNDAVESGSLEFQQSKDSQMEWTESDSQDGDWKDGYTTNQLAVSQDLAEFIHKFYDLYPSTSKLDLHIASESYGGKYIPQLVQHLVTKHPDIPLKTAAIGNGWTDPVAQIGTHPLHYMALGLIDEKQSAAVQNVIFDAQAFAIDEAWISSLRKREEMWHILSNYTGDVDMYDVRLGSNHPDHDTYANWLNLPLTKKTLHVPEWLSFGKDENIYTYLLEDIMKSERGNVEKVLKNGSVPLLLYQGNWDLRDGVISNSAWIEEAEWKGAKNFSNSPRKVWKNDKGELQGYVQQYGALTRTVLFGCGHMAPADDGCPRAAKEMMIRHTRGGAFLED